MSQTSNVHNQVEPIAIPQLEVTPNKMLDSNANLNLN